MRRAWHAFFSQTFKEDLEPAGFKVHSEFEIGKMPLRIDILAIKKAKEVKDSTLPDPCQFFQIYNIIEFKTETDPFSFLELNKLLAYCHLLVQKEKIESFEEMTATALLAGERSPEQDLAPIGFEKIGQGIWRFQGLFPCYLGLIDELPVEEKNFPLLLFAGKAKRRKILRDLIPNLKERYLTIAFSKIVERLEWVELQ